MNGKIPCDEARWLMSEALSEFPPKPNDALLGHLAQCGECRDAYQELSSTLGDLKEASFETKKPTARLWETIEARLAETPQEQPRFIPVLSSRDVLMAQYSYLVLLGSILFYALVHGQPLFLEVMSFYGISVSNWVLVEYGLLVLFLGLGGFTAMLAVPILVHAEFGKSQGKSLLSRLISMFSGNIRLIAC